MELPEIAQVARNFAVMVRIQGPDPKGLKMRKHAFHHYQSGKTTLSASGLLLPEFFIDSPVVKHFLDGNDSMASSAVIATVASIVEPFLSLQHRESKTQVQAELIPGAQIDVMVESKMKVGGGDLGEPDERTPHWLPSKLLALVDVPASSLALQSLIEAPTGSAEHGSWEVGWSLASLNNGPHHFMDDIQTQVGRDIRSSSESQGNSALGEPSNASHMAVLTTRIAFLVVSLDSKGLPNISASQPKKRGNLLLAIGSPFGVLSPMHFFNSIAVGSVANCYPSTAYKSSLLMADIRCLPGMEGGPVFGEHAHLIGILARPLRQRAGGAEIQLVIPWEAIATARSDLLQNEPPKVVKEVLYNKESINVIGKAGISNSHDSNGPFSHIHVHQDSHFPPPSPIEKAMASIALVTIDDGVWASGVLLNNHGLILTNAHLLEPWRFGKTTVLSGRDGSKSATLPISSEKPVSLWHEGSDGQEESQSFLQKTVKSTVTFVGDNCSEFKLGSIYKSYKRIRVRLDHMDPWIWCDARVVYVSKGPLDVALLQLDSVPNQLCPIIPDFACPYPGSKANVIGHGLFGPRSDLYPSVSSGVVARVVKAQRPIHSSESVRQENALRQLPAMLETTAAVHPGGSGGAVVNSDGHMIGLVTSNARHGGGTVIPHLNFSIPCAALEPIFKFSKDMQDTSILHYLDKPNEQLSSVWALIPPLSPKPGLPFPHLPQSLLEENKEGKGSRFAKFIAERHSDVFPKPIQLGKVDRFANENLPSKL
ncbi:hypothetical protein HHK36_003672 [Tetracentron sinense]|uniref:Glyoxysomal processing protease, glyoxysomal n=1 Tax=Tetracentron sinense TaxID=13715 RepID=A0A835DNT9_TETSI|nr:hypothetical protein HHK36_003672 [Tetracentron sinense]